MQEKKESEQILERINFLRRHVCPEGTCKLAAQMEDSIAHEHMRREHHPAGFRIVHHGAMYQRVEQRIENADLESAFAIAWEKKNERRGDMLQRIVDDNSPMFGWCLTQRDAYVAASVIQWLGTNVGYSFLSGVLHDCGYRIEEKLTGPRTPLPRVSDGSAK